MKIFQNKIIICGLIFWSVISTLSAQEISTMQFMKGVPQSDLFNPALHNDSTKLVIGLPGLSGVNYSLNSGFSIDKLLHKGTGILADSLVLDLEKFNNSLSTSNTISQQLGVPLLYVGYHIKKSFFSLVVSEKAMANLSFDKNLITFLKDGNASFMGQNYDLGGLKLDAFQYSEFALGYSTSMMNNKLTIGMRAKVLFGKFAVQTEKMNLKVETAADGSYINLNSDIKVNMSSPLSAEYDQDGYFSGMKDIEFKPVDYMADTGNKGFAFDFGAVYRLTPKILLSASLVDIGKINFSNNLLNLTQAASYKWEGIDFSKSIDTKADDYVKPSDLIETETNKLTDTFRPKNTDFSSEAFGMNIPAKIFLGGTYNISRNFNVGILDRYYKSANYSQNSITLSANALLGKFFSLTGSYSMIGKSNNNLGLGMALRLGFIQIYLVNDNVLAIVDPAKVEIINMRFGLNLLFGRKN